MKSAEIQALLDAGETEFVVNAPHPFGRGTVSTFARVLAQHGRKWKIEWTDAHDRTFTPEVSPQAILRTAAQERYLRAWNEAIREDNARRMAAEYAAERAAIDAKINETVGMFDGIMVPAESVSSANFDRPPIDLGAYLREAFINNRYSGTTFSWDTFDAIGRRMQEMQQALLDSAGGFVPAAEPVVDTGRPELVELPHRGSADALIRKVAEMEAGT